MSLLSNRTYKLVNPRNKTVGVATTLTSNDSGTTYIATAAITMTLPSAVEGLRFRFLVNGANALTIAPQTGEYMPTPSTGAYGNATFSISADAAGEYIELECFEATKWSVTSYIGTWTKAS